MRSTLPFLLSRIRVSFKLNLTDLRRVVKNADMAYPYLYPKGRKELASRMGLFSSGLFETTEGHVSELIFLT